MKKSYKTTCGFWLAGALCLAAGLIPAEAGDRWGDDHLIVDDPAEEEGQFEVAIGSDGTYWGLVAYDDIYPMARTLLRSTDEGQTWEEEGTMNFHIAGDPLETRLGLPRVVSDYIYMPYVHGNQLGLWRTNTSTMASSIIIIATEAFDDGIQSPVIAFDDAEYGTSYFAYLAYRYKTAEDPDQWEIRVMNSNDHGDTWHAAHTMPNLFGPDLAYGDGLVHVIGFTTMTEQGQYIVHSSSYNRGGTWSPDHYAEQLNLPELLTDVQIEAVQGTGITVVSYTRWLDGEADIYSRYSDSGGQSWQPRAAIVSDPNASAEKHDLQSSAEGGRISLAYWEDDQIGVVGAYVGNGLQWSHPLVISDVPEALSAYWPRLALTPGSEPETFVTWTDERTATRAIYSDQGSALTYRMAPDGSGTFATLQMALDEVPEGAILELADGIYAGEGNRDLDFGGKGITMRSTSRNPATCIIDCGGSAAAPHRAVRFYLSEGHEARIEDITIRNGYEWDGGGISCVDGSSPALVGCIFENCTAEDDGGALHCAAGSSPLVQECIFQNNQAGDRGGAVHINESAPIFEDCEFSSNTAGDDGGGLAVNTRSNVSVYHSVIHGNQSADNGGGIHVYEESALHLEACTLDGNEATGSGGALRATGVNQINLVESTFADNVAPLGGGLMITGETVVGLGRSIVAFNGPGEGIACADYGEVDLSCCDLFGNAGGDWTGCVAAQYGLNCNISSDPRFCAPGLYTLAENSLCSMEHSPCSEQIGAHGTGCSPIVYTHNLSPDGSGDFPSIQAAVEAAADGDVIELADGSYTAQADHDVDFLGKAITIRSQGGVPENCTIKCAFGTPERGFLFRSGEGPDARLENLRIWEAGADTGAAVLCVDASPTLSNVLFLGNYASQVGGGVACLGGAAPNLIGCEFNGNAAEDDGGGLWCYESNPVLTDCTFFYNDADDNGGGFYAAGNCDPHLTNCVFDQNHAQDAGAGVGFVNSGGQVEGSTFFNGETNVGGGALFFHGYCTTHISNCTAFNNSGAEGSSVLVRHYSTPVFENTILSFGFGGPAVTCTSASTISLSCCNIFGHPGGDWVGCIAGQLDLNGNIGEDPLFCDPYDDEFTVQNTSGCAAENNPACGQIGAWGVGCDGYLFPPENYTVGAGPIDMAVADFNQDPYPDLVVADYDAGKLAILYGSQTGEFHDPWPISWGDVPRAVAVGDMDGDGWKDLVVAEPATDRVAVLLGQGIGMFQSPVHYAVGDGPNDVALEDLNGDEALDVVVTGHWSDTIEILLGVGDGTLEAASTQSVGSRPQSIALDDFDGDDVPDCIVANSSSPHVTFLRGLGNGSFDSGVDYEVGYGPVAIAVGDLNRDTLLDIATANQVVGTASVLRGNGDGTFQTADSYPAGEQPSAVAIGDIDGDQWPDLVVANRSSNNIAVFRNAGTRALEEPIFYAVGEEPMALTLTDIDDNGTPDVQVVGYADSSLAVLRSPDPGTSGVDPQDPPMVSNATFSIHPNPIRGKTTCFFGGSAPAQGRIAIFDVTGREVWQRHIAGESSAVWDGRSSLGEPVAPGVYYLWWLPDQGTRRTVRAVVVR